VEPITRRDLSSLAEFDALEGRPARQLDEQARCMIEQCVRAGAARQSAKGVMKVISRFWSRQVAAAARPAEIRRALFERAASAPSRQQAFDMAAADLGIGIDDVKKGLFADRPGQRRLHGPEKPIDPNTVIELYNLSLVQGLLARSERVAALVRENVRSVVRFAKLKGLLCTYHLDPSGTMIELSGPLSLFRNTLRYGHALAAFFPSVVVTPGWSLHATCLLRPPTWLRDDPDTPELNRYRFQLDATAPVHTNHRLPAETDSAVERKLIRDVRRAQRDWRIERETTALRAGRSVFFPDFRLVRGSEHVLVELVGYYTAEYLDNKLRKIREANIDNLLVCVDEGLACTDDEVRADAVLRYAKRMDANVLLDAAERLIERRALRASTLPACSL
ncbi:MAG: DUF790 family protein, partial [Myxococcota bacterium]